MKTLATTLAVAAVFFGLSTTAQSAAQPTIDVVASNWKFAPNTIQLHVGQETTLRLTSTDGVHGLQFDDLGIPMTMITPGSAKTVNVTAKKAGKYVLHCAIMCGAGHPNMTLTVNVVP
ncbi:MAG TPA: cupredoxin domain-containing protein [Candidatus Cybelea sp.]|jgi:cytochrome c oxidase subunit 2